jgi:ribA/ribD-fused uncharacterized protein
MINKFREQYSWLSNFAKVSVEFDGVVYPSVENAYQAAKLVDKEARVQFQTFSSKEAKQFYKKNKITAVWTDETKLQVMESFLRQKYAKEPFKTLLKETGTVEIVEGNYWHDNFYGSCSCNKCGNKGDNKLGKLLMKIRSEL